MKYGHIKTRLDDNKTGFVDIKNYNNIEIRDCIGTCLGFNIIDNFKNVHINKKGHIVKNEA
jgi:hypothetical protein